jgi:hypothetical protein
MTGLIHTVRASLLDRERNWRLGDEALEWEAGGLTGSVRFDDVGKLQLIDYAGPGGRHRQLKVTARDGTSLRLRSHHYRSLGSFENRSRSYAPFVRELIRRVGAANPKARFEAGSTGLWLAWSIVALLLAALVALVPIALLDGAYSWGGLAVALLLIVGSGPFVWRSVWRARTAEFDPAAPPEGLIGG